MESDKDWKVEEKEKKGCQKREKRKWGKKEEWKREKKDDAKKSSRKRGRKADDSKGVDHWVQSSGVPSPFRVALYSLNLLDPWKYKQ